MAFINGLAKNSFNDMIGSEEIEFHGRVELI